MQTYVVQMGDTLYGISKQFGITVEELRLENDLTNNTLRIGQILRIPTVETTSLYVVKKGDTLYSIASRYDVSVNALISLNNLNNTNLSIGQQLRIPINGDTSNDDFVIYTVKVGDNLYSIAKKYNTTVDEIVNFNNLNSNLLMIGQQLKIPINSNDDIDNQYGTYIVQSGDTLYKIAKRYGMTVSQLMAINNLEGTSLNIGQVLKVNSGGGDSSGIVLGASCYGEGYKEPTYITYVVKRGDNLYNIARKYGTSVDNLIKLNNLTNNNLTIGQVLKIREVN